MPGQAPRALISVSDKRGLAPFAKGLVELGYTLLSTGGTMAAAVQLLEQAGADVQATACIVELSFLGGRDKLSVPTHSLITYDA